MLALIFVWIVIGGLRVAAELTAGSSRSLGGAVLSAGAMSAGWWIASVAMRSALRRRRDGSEHDRRWMPPMLVVALVVVGGIAIAASVEGVLLAGLGEAQWPGLARLLLTDIDRDVFFGLGVSAASIASARHLEVRERERTLLIAERERAQATLDVLEAQLQPHFLFNTLHSIAALIHLRGVDARMIIDRLRELLAPALQDSAPAEVSLETELRVVHAYLDIQRTRFGETLTVSTDIANDALSFAVPRLILQPIVENAVLHGLAGSKRVGAIGIRATVVGGELRVEVRDNGPGVDDTLRAESGIGLWNTRERLRQRQGAGDWLVLTTPATGGCVVSLRILAIAAVDGDTRVGSRDNSAVSGARLGVYALCALLMCAPGWLMLSFAHRRMEALPYSSEQLAVMALVQSILIVVVLSVVAFTSSRFALDGNRVRLAVAVHLALPIASFASHLSLDSLLRSMIALPHLKPAPLLLFHVGACASVAALIQRAGFLRRASAAQAGIARATRDRANALLALRRLRLDARRIDGWLAELSELVVGNPATAGAVTLAIADFLRLIVRAGVMPELSTEEGQRIAFARERVESLLTRVAAS